MTQCPLHVVSGTRGFVQSDKKVSIAEIRPDNAEQWISDLNDPLSTFICAGFMELHRLLDEAEIII